MARLAAVVPTLGESPHLAHALAALRAEGVEILLVHQGPRRLESAQGLADGVLRLERNRGFAAGTNAGIEAARRDAAASYVATVNDDAIVQPGWAETLLAALDRQPAAASAQGVHLCLATPQLMDGGGIAWNRSLQAVQLGHGRPAPPAGGPPREIFGVAATAAVYRRAALEAVALAPGVYFDPGLGSYYEDVDLACRLRAHGWAALSVPAAGVLHAASTTGRRRPLRRLTALYGNRYLVLARALRGGFWRELPRLLVRDVRDAGRALVDGDGGRLLGISAGWSRALRHLPSYLARGAPLLSRDDLLQFPAEAAQ